MDKSFIMLSAARTLCPLCRWSRTGAGLKVCHHLGDAVYFYFPLTASIRGEVVSRNIFHCKYIFFGSYTTADNGEKAQKGNSRVRFCTHRASLLFFSCSKPLCATRRSCLKAYVTPRTRQFGFPLWLTALLSEKPRHLSTFWYEYILTRSDNAAYIMLSKYVVKL